MRPANPLWFVEYFRRYTLNLSACGQVIGESGFLPVEQFCAMCHVPIDSRYRFCVRCARYSETARSIPVFPLTWTPKGCAFYCDMLVYKRRKDPQAINRLEMLANWVSWHKSCLQTTCFQPDLCAIVPSGRGNPPNTELQKLAQLLSGAPSSTFNTRVKLPTSAVCNPRRISLHNRFETSEWW